LFNYLHDVLLLLSCSSYTVIYKYLFQFFFIAVAAAYQQEIGVWDVEFWTLQRSNLTSKCLSDQLIIHVVLSIVLCSLKLHTI
jgi:hypothetical protein